MRSGAGRATPRAVVGEDGQQHCSMAKPGVLADETGRRGSHSKGIAPPVRSRSRPRGRGTPHARSGAGAFPKPACWVADDRRRAAVLVIMRQQLARHVGPGQADPAATAAFVTGRTNAVEPWPVPLRNGRSPAGPSCVPAPDNPVHCRAGRCPAPDRTWTRRTLLWRSVGQVLAVGRAFPGAGPASNHATRVSSSVIAAVPLRAC